MNKSFSIKEARLKKGISIEELAHRLKISPFIIKKIENNEELPKKYKSYERIFRNSILKLLGLYKISGEVKLKEIPQNISNIAETLDTRIVEEYILKPILGIENIRTDDRIDFVGGPQSIEKIVNLVDSGIMKIGIALPTTAIEELLKISDSDQLMPPKSTWFEPKLADGLVSLKI